MEGERERPRQVVSSMVAITYDPNVLDLSADQITSLLRTSQVSGEAVRKVFGEAVPVDVSFGGTGRDMGSLSDRRRRYMRGGGGKLVGIVSVVLAPTPKADALLREVCARLRLAIQAAYESELSGLKKQLLGNRQTTDDARTKLQALQKRRQELEHQAGRSDLSRRSVLKDLQKLEGKKHALEGSLAGNRARIKAYQEQIAKFGTRATQTVGEDGVLKELKVLVKARQDQWDVVVRQAKAALEAILELHKRHTASNFELKKAKAVVLKAELDGRVAVAQARAEIARRRADIQGKQGEKLLANLNESLSTVTVFAAGEEAELKVVSDAIDRLRKNRVLELAETYERDVRFPLEMAEQEHIGLMKIEMGLAPLLSRAKPPTVTVMAPPADKPK